MGRSRESHAAEFHRTDHTGGLDFSGAPGGAGTRPFSTMGNPDFLAAYLVAVLPMAVGLWFARRSASGTSCQIARQYIRGSPLSINCFLPGLGR